MARTRLEIKTLVRSHTGRTDDSLENSLCETALKMALSKHPFNAAISTPADFTLVEDNTSIDISSASAIRLVTLRIVEADGTRNAPLRLKNRTWWDKNIVNEEDNQKGWPVYALRTGDIITFDRPLMSGLELRLRITTEQTFAGDSSVCPIPMLDLFIEKYVTALVYLDKKIIDSYLFWKSEALGPDYDRGDIGGALKDAIHEDLFEIAEDVKVEMRGAEDIDAISILDNTASSATFGNVRTWYNI